MRAFFSERPLYMKKMLMLVKRNKKKTHWVGERKINKMYTDQLYARFIDVFFSSIQIVHTICDGLCHSRSGIRVRVLCTKLTFPVLSYNISNEKPSDRKYPSWKYPTIFTRSFVSFFPFFSTSVDISSFPPPLPLLLINFLQQILYLVK